MKFCKGDVVRAKAFVWTTKVKYGQRGTLIHEPETGTHKRYLFRRETLFEGMVVGYSFRQTGEIHPSSGSWDDYDPGYLHADNYHFVYLVEPINNERWLEPYACLPEDLLLLRQARHDLTDWSTIAPLEETSKPPEREFICPVCGTEFYDPDPTKQYPHGIICPECKALAKGVIWPREKRTQK